MTHDQTPPTGEPGRSPQPYALALPTSDLRGVTKDAITKSILTILQERRPINWDESDRDYPLESETDRRMWLAIDALASLLARPDGKKRRRLRERAADLLAAKDAEALALGAA